MSVFGRGENRRKDYRENDSRFFGSQILLPFATHERTPSVFFFLGASKRGIPYAS